MFIESEMLLNLVDCAVMYSGRKNTKLIPLWDWHSHFFKFSVEPLMLETKNQINYAKRVE